MLGLCPYCQERPSDLTGYASDPTCLGCSPLVVDETRDLTNSPLWLLIQPSSKSDKFDEVGSSFLKDLVEAVDVRGPTFRWSRQTTTIIIREVDIYAR